MINRFQSVCKNLTAKELKPVWIVNRFLGIIAGATQLKETPDDVVNLVSGCLKDAPSYRVAAVDGQLADEEWESALRKRLEDDQNFQVDLKGAEGEAPVVLMIAKQR